MRYTNFPGYRPDISAKTEALATLYSHHVLGAPYYKGVLICRTGRPPSPKYLGYKNRWTSKGTSPKKCPTDNFFG